MGNDVGLLVRETRLCRKLTQKQLARWCATSQRHISRIERGEVSPTVKTLEKLMHAMGKRLELSVVPGPKSNMSTAELRAALETTTAGERIAEAAELSEFLTGIVPEVDDAFAEDVRRARESLGSPVSAWPT
jgi:transcriptional regulator with XRE-family HTH domain